MSQEHKMESRSTPLITCIYLVKDIIINFSQFRHAKTDT
ncbi:unnamed protein product [Arabidopsis halleri]